MYLTKIELDPRRRFARRLLGSPQVMHAVVMKACDLGRSIDGDRGDPAGSTSEDLPAHAETPTSIGVEASSARAETSAAGRVLWRVDQGGFGVALYVLSPMRPDMSQIEADATSSQLARTLDYEGFLSRLAEGQTWAFRLAANPVHNENRGPDKRGKRYGHVTARQQRDWLLKRAEKQGFSIPMAPAGPGLTRHSGDGRAERVELGENGKLGGAAAREQNVAAAEALEGSA
ncbi:MAG: type I-E CRISPR-associated protein Cas6/Cse3/CasE, partial [Peptidiphaga gingivicola]